MGAQFTVPLVTVIPGQLIASALWNNEFQNINTNFVPAGMDSYSDTDGQMQIQTPPYLGSVTSHASNLGGEIERIRYQISAMLGATTPAFWYAKPPIDLTTLSNITIPIGGTFDYPSATPPSANYLLANGQAIGRIAYAAAFALMGTTFGIGDGSTTFNIPNYTDKMSIAAGNLYALAATGGATNHTLVDAEIPSTTPVAVSITDPGHTHTITDPNHSHGVTDPGHVHAIPTITTGGATNRIVQATGVASSNVNTNSATTGLSVNSGSTGITGANSHTTGITAAGTLGGGNGAHSILNPYLAMYKLIRVL